MTHDWANNPRWKGVERPYTAEDVFRLRGSIFIEHTLARLGAERLWDILRTEPYINALGAMIRQPGGAAGASRAEGDLRQWMAGRCRRE